MMLFCCCVCVHVLCAGSFSLIDARRVNPYAYHAFVMSSHAFMQMMLGFILVIIKYVLTQGNFSNPGSVKLLSESAALAFEGRSD
jgi:hypothetical protein